MSMCVRRLGRVVTSGKVQGYGDDDSTKIKINLRTISNVRIVCMIASRMYPVRSGRLA